MIVEKTRAFAKENHDSEGFKYHILPVVKNAMLLAKKLHADLEVVETAAFLHDIGVAAKIAEFEVENDHHITGSEIAGEFLQKTGCKKEFIEKVKHCILAHRGRKGPKPETLEAEIIANADAMAHFESFLTIFGYFLKTTSSFEEAVVEVEKKMQRDWNKKLTLPEAKEIVKPKYEAIMLVLKSTMEYFEK
ncbi:MAG: HD domain-containing protein [Candidatus Diapherotrites archaeon]|nr:HD domain-containing protein [Candidatus Diapherotrites archaeon]